MKRQPKLTKRERKALTGGPAPSSNGGHAAHIHCIDCGRHLNPGEFSTNPPSAMRIRCAHGTQFTCCVACEAPARVRLSNHDRDGVSVDTAAPWH